MQIGGIDANQIVSDLMALERRPLEALEARQETAELARRAIGGVRTNVESIRLASNRLSEPDAFARFSTSSSDAAVVASASSAASPASLSFSVAQLATSHGLRSIGTVATSDTVITAAATISLATGDPSDVGVAAVRATPTLGAGDHDVTVIQASSAARKTGTALAASTSFGPGSEFVDVDVNGVAVSIEFTAGTYTAQDIADTVQAAFTTAGADASASIDADGRLVVATTGEGSSKTLQFTGGPLASIGMTADVSAITGSDAIVEVGEESTTLADLPAGGTVTVTTAEGDLELDLAGSGLRVGTLSVETVEVGSGSLADVAAAINGSDAGVSAAAIRVGDDEWRLQLTSQTTGDDGTILVDDAAFAGVGGMIESSAGTNAEIVIGSGPGAYTVESSSNTFEDVLTGTSVTVNAVTTDPVTVSVSRDNSGIAGDVSSLVSAMNTALADLKVQTRYGVEGTGNGALAGDGSVRRLIDQLRASLSRPVDGADGLIPADVGIEVNRDGTFTFDSAAFTSALAEDPDAVAAFFGRNATTPAGITFDAASAVTTTGSYDVEVTTAATQATSARLYDGGVATSGRIGVRDGDISVEIDVTAGQSAAEVIDNLNAALIERGLEITAEADAGGLVLRAEGWGVEGNYELNTDVGGAGTWDAVDGVDVVGTIDGVDATGIGRTLSLNALVDSPAAGLSLQIDGGVTGVLGAVEYQPGLGARVSEVTTRMLGEEGSLESVEGAQQRRIDDFNDQIENFEDRLFTREATLRRQWANLQTVLEQLQQRGNWLSGQLAGLG